MNEIKNVLTVDKIRNYVYTIRGQQVMLDNDLADIYGYELKVMNQQVKRNIERFPDDFMFQLTREEVDSVRSQIVTSRKSPYFKGQEGGRRWLPYVFTEQGIYMLATVLKGELAVQQSVFIMRAFKEMRHYIMQNQQFVTQTEMNLISSKVSNLSIELSGVADSQKKTNKRIEEIKNDIDILSNNFITEKDIKNYVIYKGQKFEADLAYINIYRQAKKSIYVIDDYVNSKTLELLSQKQDRVEIILFTENKPGKNGFLTSSIVNDFNKQYPPLKIKHNTESHDRWIVIDYNLPSEQLYQCGTSSKDAGAKLCAINKLDHSEIIHPVIDRLLSQQDKTID